MMKFKKFKYIITQLHNLKEEKNKYIHDVPIDIRIAIFDNRYSILQGQEYSVLFCNLFSKELQYDVDWFLTEWQPGFEITTDGDTWKIYTIDDYFDYVNRVYKLK